MDITVFKVKTILQLLWKWMGVSDRQLIKDTTFLWQEKGSEHYLESLHFRGRKSQKYISPVMHKCYHLNCEDIVKHSEHSLVQL